MFKLISNLQKKPEGYKRGLALVVSVGFTIIVIIVWLSTLFSGGVSTEDQKEESDFSLDGAIAPIQSLSSAFTSTIDSIKGLFDEVRPR